MNSEMDISKNQWRSTGGKGIEYVKCPFLSTRGGEGGQNWVNFGPRSC